MKSLLVFLSLRSLIFICRFWNPASICFRINYVIKELVDGLSYAFATVKHSRTDVSSVSPSSE